MKLLYSFMFICECCHQRTTITGCAGTAIGCVTTIDWGTTAGGDTTIGEGSGIGLYIIEPTSPPAKPGQKYLPPGPQYE